MTEKIRHILYSGHVEIDFYPNSHRYKLVKFYGEEKNEWLLSPTKIGGTLDKSDVLIGWAVRMFYQRMVKEMGDGSNFTYHDVKSMLEVAKTAHTQAKKDAADVGTVVHEYAQKHHRLSDVEEIEKYGELSDEDKVKAKNGQVAFDSWYAKQTSKSLKSEFLVYSRDQNVVGTCDELHIHDDGSLEIFDYKTSKGIYTTQVYQISLYMKAYEEEHLGQFIKGARLVHFYKEDILDKDQNIIHKAGEYGELYLTRGDIVKAYKIFKALKVVTEGDVEISNLIKEKYAKI